MNLKSLSLPLLPLIFILLGQSAAVEFSKPEWTHPARTGSSIWLRNDGSKSVRIDSLFVRNDGIHTGKEVALKLGRRTYRYKAARGMAGQWARLTPVKGTRRIGIRAGDSLMVTHFEYGNHLRSKKPKKTLTEDYVLDLKLVDNGGDSAIVKISESAPRYIIHGAPDGAGIGSGMDEWSRRADRTGEESDW